MKIIIHILLLLFSLNHAVAGGIFKQSIDADYGVIYTRLYKALEDKHFYVVNEINIGKNLSGFADKWGNDYNRNQLSNIQVMIICNGWYANQVSNLDTDMLALCPMSVTLISKDKQVTALFARPSTFAANSKALPVLQEAEQAVIDAIESAMK